MDDSNYRGTHGGCLATTLGSVLHELGHTFDLGHTRDGIMGRGFDYIDRVFVGAAGIDSNRNHPVRREPQHTTIALSRPLNVTVTVQQERRQQQQSCPRRRGRLLSETSYGDNSKSPGQLNFEGSTRAPGRLSSAPTSPELSHRSFTTRNVETPAQIDRTFWGSSCAALLAYHRWFNTDNVRTRGNEDDLRYDAKRYNNLFFFFFCQFSLQFLSFKFFFLRNVVRSRHGIRIIELRESVGGMVVASRQFNGNHLTLEAVVPAPPSHCVAALSLIAENSIGGILKHPLPTSF